MSWLGILDLGISIAESVELAPRVDALGYTRYWFAEHQPQPSPILLAMLVAGQTERIRVGAAGILLHYYPPVRTAHDFHMLDAAFTGRIDAGFCGGIALPELVELDRDGRDLAAIMRAYPQRAERFIRALRNTRGDPAFDEATAWSGVAAEPPQIWWHGSSPRSADQAAALGVAYGYALMFPSSVDDDTILERYREKFVSYRGSRPRTVVAVAGACAETDDAAQALVEARSLPFIHPRVTGSPERCAAELEALRARYRADEIVFADLCPTFDSRVRCYELLAEAISRSAR